MGGERMSFERLFSGGAAVLLLCWSLAGASAVAFAAEGGGFEISNDPAQLVVSFSERVGEVQSDDHPWLRVYADGTVIRHRPAYYTNPGDFVVRLDEAELNELVQSLVDGGLMDFDTATVKAEMRAARQQNAAPVYSSDPSVFEIEVNLQSFLSGEGAVSEQNVQRHISWQGLRADARHYPSVSALADLSDACATLSELGDRAQREAPEGGVQ
jgi:hypothetical protein